VVANNEWMSRTVEAALLRAEVGIDA